MSMFHRAVLVAFLACFVLVGLAHAQTPQRVELDVVGNLKIDASGHVAGYDITSPLSQDIKSIVTGAVLGWRFEPIEREGKPVAAKVQMFLFLTGVPAEGGVRLRVERVQFGSPRKIQGVHGAASAYPHEPMRAGVGAEVLVAVRIDAAGKVLDVAPLRSRLVPRAMSDKVSLQWRAAFERGVVTMMRKATFEPADPARGDAAEVSMVLPVLFTQGPGGYYAGLWTQADTAVTSPDVPAWLGGKLQDGAFDRLKEGQNVALDGAPKLATQVVGTTL